MTAATCATCPWWERGTQIRWAAEPDPATGEPVSEGREPSKTGKCHHAAIGIRESGVREDWWCSEHPLRQRDRLAEVALQGYLAGMPPDEVIDPRHDAEEAYRIADAMLAIRAAENTSVPVDRSRAEIERVLVKYGATGFGYMWERRMVAVVPAPAHGPKVREEQIAAMTFAFKERRIRLDIPMPDDERQVRQRWRVALLVIKAKLEAVAGGISTLEQEFLANIVTENGMTIGQAILPRLSEATQAGRLLPGRTDP